MYIISAVCSHCRCVNSALPLHAVFFFPQYGSNRLQLSHLFLAARKKCNNKSSSCGGLTAVQRPIEVEIKSNLDRAQDDNGIPNYGMTTRGVIELSRPQCTRVPCTRHSLAVCTVSQWLFAPSCVVEEACTNRTTPRLFVCVRERR